MSAIRLLSQVAEHTPQSGWTPSGGVVRADSVRPYAIDDQHENVEEPGWRLGGRGLGGAFWADAVRPYAIDDLHENVEEPGWRLGGRGLGGTFWADSVRADAVRPDWARGKGVPDRVVDAAIEAALGALDRPLTRAEIAEHVSRTLGVQMRAINGWGSRRKDV